MEMTTPDARSELDKFETFISYPIQLSGGTARLYLPPKLSRNDVERISKMLDALIIEKTSLSHEASSGVSKESIT